MALPISPYKAIELVTKTVDDLTTSREEYNQGATDRLTVDTTSPFILPHLVRPILGLWITAIHSALNLWGLLSGKLSFELALEANAILVGAVFLFYFGSRGLEKIWELKGRAQIKVAEAQAKSEMKKADAAVKIETIRAKADLKDEIKRDRIERKKLRKAKKIKS